MKNFKSFIQIDEIIAVSPKAKGEGTFVKVSYLAQTKDPGDLEKIGPEEVGPKDTKLGQGKRKLDRLDNKQSFGEEIVSEEAPMAARALYAQTYAKHAKTASQSNDAKQKAYAAVEKKHGSNVLSQLKAHHENGMKEETELEEDLSTAQKALDKNKNGKIDGSDLASIRKKKQPQGADFAAQRRKERLATNGRMDEDTKQKAYNTIKAKMSNEDHQSMLMALYDDLSEQNQDSFVELLKVDPNRLLNFARSKISNNGE